MEWMRQLIWFLSRLVDYISLGVSKALKTQFQNRCPDISDLYRSQSQKGVL